MGLDTVELAMAFEERFAVTIPDDVAERIVTVRDAIDFIYAHVPHAETPGSPTCLSQHAFYRLRKAARSELGVARSEVRPSTPLDAIVPLEGRLQAWDRLRQAAEMTKWPSLVRSGELVTQIAAGSAATTIATLLLTQSAILAAATGIAATYTLIQATARYRLHFANPGTAGQLAEFMAANSPPDGSHTGGWTRDQVRIEVRRIVTEHLNVEPTFSDDATFIDDLGAD